jgi:hypothetical protein
MVWLFQGREVTPEDLAGYKSFVYVITNTVNGKQYIGKKKLFFTRSKRLKNSKRRIREVKDSDWEDYYGSSDTVAKDIVCFGKEAFRREILHLCESPAKASYYEIKEQLLRDVLLKPVEFYNSFVGCKIHRSHVLGK